MKILVTGAAGFIGWKVCEFLLSKPELIPGFQESCVESKATKMVSSQRSSERNKKGLSSWKQILLARSQAQWEKENFKVIGVDNMNDYYDVRLKEWRLAQLKKFPNFEFHKLDIEDFTSLRQLFEKYSAPQSPLPRRERTKPALSKVEGVRVNDVIANRPSSSQLKQSHSSTNQTNSTNKTNATNRTNQTSVPFSAVINLAARAGVRYSLENPFVYYTTNVMGNLNLLELCREFGVKKYILASSSSLYAGQKMPFKEDLPVNEPISPYAASKKSGEVTCYTYHNLYDIDVSILRYFTVYGPASRPDMAPYRFISWIDREKPVTIYGDGTQSRDFTYVDDIAKGTIAALKPIGFEIVNLGSNGPLELIEFLHIIEKQLKKKANIVYEPFSICDMKATWADISKAKEVLGWEPTVKIDTGVESAVRWYIENRSLAAFIKL